MSTENIRKPYRSCYYLESGITFASNEIAFCCDRPSPATVQPMADAGKTVDAFLEARDRVIRENQGITPPCAGCSRFQEYKLTNGKINYINFAVHKFCNFSCTYCVLQQSGAQDKNRLEPYDALEIAKELKRRGLLSQTLNIICGPGEITVHPRREEYYNFIEENAYSVQFVSNAGRFDPKLAHILSLSPQNRMLVSIDSGTEETFRQVHGVDMFKQVVANLMEYRKYSPNIYLKYILLDENCDDEDLNGFIQLCNELKPAQMIVSGDNGKVWDWGNPLSTWDISLIEEHIVRAAIKLVEGAKESNIGYAFYDCLGQANLREIHQRLSDPELVSARNNKQADLQETYRKLAALPEVVSAEQQLDIILSASKVVCYGAGANCRNVLNQIKALGLRKPDVIWDIKAESGQMFCTGGGEYPVCQPDFSSLNGSTEIGMFITITNSAINQELAKDMKERGFSHLLMNDQLSLALMMKRAKMALKWEVKK